MRNVCQLRHIFGYHKLPQQKKRNTLALTQSAFYARSIFYILIRKQILATTNCVRVGCTKKTDLATSTKQFLAKEKKKCIKI